MDSIKTLCIVPARGGSKRIPGKNLRPVAGKPLIIHTLDQARSAECIQRIIVSTDSDEIASVVRARGVEVIMRPVAISGDDSPSEAAISHVLDVLSREEQREPDTIIFLQCTAPIRTGHDIDSAMRKFEQEKADSLLSLVEASMFLWTIKDRIPEPLNYSISSRPRSQELDPVYIENGSIYIFKPQVLRTYGSRLGGKISAYLMERSSAIDIDDPTDLEFAEYFLSRNNVSSV